MTTMNNEAPSANRLDDLNLGLACSSRGNHATAGEPVTLDQKADLVMGTALTRISGQKTQACSSALPAQGSRGYLHSQNQQAQHYELGCLYEHRTRYLGA